MLAPAPLKKDFIPSLARIFWAQSMDPENFSASPEVIIILLLMVSMGQEASPDPTVTPQPIKKLTPRLSLRSAGRRGLMESQIPKQRPRQMTIPTHEITNPLQRPAIPSVAMVFLQTSINPVNCFCPPFLADLRSLVSLVLAQSKEQTKSRETEPAAPPEARFPRNQTKYPSLSLFLPKSLLKQSLSEKLRAWVGKYLITLVPFPFQRAFTPSSAMIRLAQSPIPAQGLSMAPVLSIASTFWSLSLMTSMGEAKVLETAAETPPMRKSRAKVPRSFFLPPFSAILLKQNYIKVEHNYINQIRHFIASQTFADGALGHPAGVAGARGVKNTHPLGIFQSKGPLDAQGKRRKDQNISRSASFKYSLSPHEPSTSAAPPSRSPPIFFH